MNYNDPAFPQEWAKEAIGTEAFWEHDRLLIREARAEALEEAAKAVETFGDPRIGDVDRKDVANTIRALKEKV